MLEWRRSHLAIRSGKWCSCGRGYNLGDWQHYSKRERMPDYTVITMGNRTLSIDSGFTILDSSPAGAHTDGLGIAYLIQGTAAAVNPIWTVSSGAKLAVRIASFKPASAANALGSYYYRMLAGIEA
jgi:hypothetical protein